MQKENDFVLTRTFNAPRALVFKTFTEAEHLAKWWGPKGFEMLVTKLDFKPGGMFHYCMRSINNEFYEKGHEMWGRFVYLEIVAPEKIVYINSFSDKDGNITRHPMAPNWPAEMYNEWTFTEEDGKTTLTLRGRAYNATPEEIKTYTDGFRSMEYGFGGTFDQWVNYLESIQH